MSERFKIVSGDFEGNFYTHQKSVLSASEWNTAEKNHTIHLYRGELTSIKEEKDYHPEAFRNRDTLLFHNIDNIQFHLNSQSKEINEKFIHEFDQLVLYDTQIKESWELNGKTYGIITGKLYGKVKNRKAVIDPTNPPLQPVDPESAEKITKLDPEEKVRETWDNQEKITERVENNEPPKRERINHWMDSGRGCLSGCLTNFWRLLFTFLLFLFLIWLFRGCLESCSTNQSCCEERDLLKLQLERIQNKLDSIELRRIQIELNDLSSQIYFYGNTTKIRSYSENQINQIVNIIKKYPDLQVIIKGYRNGNSNLIQSDLDFDRAVEVKEILIIRGIEENRITAKGMGQSMIDPQDKYQRFTDIEGNEFRWNRNMRVEIEIIN